MIYSAYKIRRERVLERCAKMRAAKERKRLARAVAPDTVEAGAVLFRGPMFGGFHCIRIMCRSDAERDVWMEADGQVLRPRTARGARAAVARRIGRALM